MSWERLKALILYKLTSDRHIPFLVLQIQKFLWISRGQQFFFLHGDFTGTGDDVGSECIEEFYNTLREKGIPEENILNFIDNGNGIILFPCPYHSPGL